MVMLFSGSQSLSLSVMAVVVEVEVAVERYGLSFRREERPMEMRRGSMAGRNWSLGWRAS